MNPFSNKKFNPSDINPEHNPVNICSIKILNNLILMSSCSPYTELVLGVVTHGGTLSVTLNHMESSISTKKVLKIRELATKIIMNVIK